MTNNKTENQVKENQPVRKLARGIYRIWIPLSLAPVTDLTHVNAYIFEGSQGWWLLDAGWSRPETFQALQEALKFLKIEFGDINTILLTHCHPDHYGLAGKIKRLSPKVRVALHRKEADLIDARYINYNETEMKQEEQLAIHGVPLAEQKLLASASLNVLEMVDVVKPDLLLTGGEIMRTGVFNLEVIWTPGHSPGHICFYEPQNQFFFSGDHILPNITPNISYHLLSGPDPLGDYLNTFDKLASLPVKEVHPGHEDSFHNLKKRLNEIAEHHQLRENEIYNLITDQARSAFQIAARLQWNVRGLTWEKFSPWYKRMATTEVIAHLQFMEHEGRIRKENDDKYILYRIM